MAMEEKETKESEEEMRRKFAELAIMAEYIPWDEMFEDEPDTRAARRERRKANRRKMGVSGRGIKTIQEALRNRWRRGSDDE